MTDLNVCYEVGHVVPVALIEWWMRGGLSVWLSHHADSFPLLQHRLHSCIDWVLHAPNKSVVLDI